MAGVDRRAICKAEAPSAALHRVCPSGVARLYHIPRTGPPFATEAAPTLSARPLHPHNGSSDRSAAQDRRQAHRQDTRRPRGKGSPAALPQAIPCKGTRPRAARTRVRLKSALHAGRGAGHQPPAAAHASAMEASSSPSDPSPEY